MPDGTVVDMPHSDKIYLRYPEGIYLLTEENNEAGFALRSSDSYTCTCEGGEGDGCDVFYFRGEIGCTSCTGSCTGQRSSEPGTNHNAGFINASLGISLADTEAGETNYLDAPSFDLLSNLEGFQEDIEAFYTSLGISSEFRNEPTETMNMRAVAVNVYGSFYTLALPAEEVEKLRQDENLAFKISDVPIEEISCECESGNAGCTLDSGGWPGPKWYRCVAATCTSCTMNGI